MKRLDPAAQLILFLDEPPPFDLPPGAPCPLCAGGYVGIFDFACPGCRQRHAREFPLIKRPAKAAP